MDSSKEKLARFGLFAKSLVYTLISLLSALAAYNINKKTSVDTETTVHYLSNQFFSTIVLIIIVLGLLAYIVLRLYQTFADHKDEVDDSTGILERLAYFSSAIIYSLIAFFAVKLIVTVQSHSNMRRSILGDFLLHEYGKTAISLIAVILIIKGILQIYRAYSASFKEGLKESSMHTTKYEFLVIAGSIGVAARGIVILIISYILYKITQIDTEIGEIHSEIWSLLENQCGSIFLAIIAIGLLAYAYFVFMQARYTRSPIH